MKISVAQLIHIMPGYKSLVLDYLPHLNAAIEEFEINTALRVSAFLAQIAVETGELHHLKENLNYSAAGLRKTFPRHFNYTTALIYANHPEKIANRVYAGRMGNGKEDTGDGWKYRGRGAIQLTGKSNYHTYGVLLKIPLADQPELAEQPELAFRIAAQYWKMNGCNELSDLKQFDTITQRINGGLNGQSERLKYYARAKEAIR